MPLFSSYPFPLSLYITLAFYPCLPLYLPTDLPAFCAFYCRNVSSANHQRLLSGARFGGNGGGGGGTSAGRWSRRKVSGLSSSSPNSNSHLARKSSHSRVQTAAVMKGIVRLQALYRMYQGQSSFLAKKHAAGVIARAWRNGQATANVSFVIYIFEILFSVVSFLCASCCASLLLRWVLDFRWRFCVLMCFLCLFFKGAYRFTSTTAKSRSDPDTPCFDMCERCGGGQVCICG